MEAIARKTYDDLSAGSRQYIDAASRTNHAGGLVPMEVFLFSMVEYGFLVARVRAGKAGLHPDDFEFRPAPELTDEQFTAGFNALAHLMDDSNS